MVLNDVFVTRSKVGGKNGQEDKYIVLTTEYIYTTCKISKVQYSGNKSNKSILNYELQDIRLQTKAKNPSRKERFTRLVHLVLTDRLTPKVLGIFTFQHSSSRCTETEFLRKKLHFGRRECLGEYIGDHFGSWAVNDS